MMRLINYFTIKTVIDFYYIVTYLYQYVIIKNYFVYYPLNVVYKVILSRKTVYIRSVKSSSEKEQR